MRVRFFKRFDDRLHGFRKVGGDGNDGLFCRGLDTEEQDKQGGG